MVTKTEIRELNRQSEDHEILPVAPRMVQLGGSVVEASSSPGEIGPLVGEARLTPEGFTLGSLRDGRLRVVEPIEVTQMMEGEKYVVEALNLNEFGFGDNPSEAIADLQAAIAELYFTLEAEQHRLGPDLAAVWGEVSRKVRKADAADRP